MIEIEWGPEIPVDGVRPAWLAGDPKKVWPSNRQGNWLDRSINAAFDMWAWEWIGAIRLPADHPHYAAQEPRTAPSGGEVGQEVVGVLVEALAAIVYEATHLSPCKPNGDHDCTIKADTLDEARGALARGRALLPEPVDALERRHPTTDSRGA